MIFIHKKSNASAKKVGWLISFNIIAYIQRSVLRSRSSEVKGHDLDIEITELMSTGKL